MQSIGYQNENLNKDFKKKPNKPLIGPLLLFRFQLKLTNHQPITTEDMIMIIIITVFSLQTIKTRQHSIFCQY